MTTRSILCALVAACPLIAQQQQYVATNITGQLVHTATVNLLQQAQQSLAVQKFQLQLAPKAETPRAIPLLHPPLAQRFAAATAAPAVKSLAVLPGLTSSGFNGLTHADQRNANHGNQFSVEPPSPSIAVGNGFVLQGVNNAVQVFNPSGAPLLPAAVSSNQLFGLAPAIVWSTGVNGVFPTDMRVFFDQGINRWFVLQQDQDNDASGNPLNSSHIYIAASQTGDPTGAYDVYTIDTTNAQNFGCPCVSDYLQVGADQYGLYVSANEYNTFFPQYIDATILAISKASFAARAQTPSTFRFTIPFFTGYEFAIQPAYTPPGASYMLASGGVEFFLSTQASFSFDTNLALWAMSNTSSMATVTPNLVLTETLVPSQVYIFPNVANQRPGPLPYGSTLSPPGALEFLDGNDSRMLSVCYSGGRLFATFATQVADGTGHSVVGGAYTILSPTLRAGVLNAAVFRQGYLMVVGNHVLRPAVSVNAQGRGAISFTLVGPNYFPSAAWVPIDTQSTGSTVQIASPGAFPEDGFSGYNSGFGVARWGDYSSAVTASDGSIWMTTEYIPNLPRTQLANWGTFVTRYQP